jgi:hypothetical protein
MARRRLLSCALAGEPRIVNVTDNVGNQVLKLPATR